MKDANFLRFNSWQVLLEDWTVVKVSGLDSISFLHGQLTNDVKKISNNQAQLNCRLNHSGKIQAFFYIAKKNEDIYLICPDQLVKTVLDDLNKYIIMEDVEFISTDDKLFFQTDFHSIDNKLSTEFAGLNGFFTFHKDDKPEVAYAELSELIQLSNFPVWNNTIFNTQFVNETILNDLAVSYSKGCFLGQETVAKIENNRGPASFPFMIEINKRVDAKEIDLISEETKIGTYISSTFFNNKTQLHARLSREFQVEQKPIHLTINGELLEGRIIPYPYFKNNSNEELSMEMLDTTVTLFNEGKIEAAIETARTSIKILQTPDNLEILGVMLGRLEKFEEAIHYMDMLTNIDPSSVMAHTNKSLFLMRLGKIEEAEEQKSLATVKSFEKFGSEAKQKKLENELKLKKESEIIGREVMFLKVLDIDSEDEIANFGMGDISFIRGEYDQAIKYLSQAILSNRNYSSAYLLIGKCFEFKKDFETAKEIYTEGIKVATKKGEMMPANEMQARLNLL